MSFVEDVRGVVACDEMRDVNKKGIKERNLSQWMFDIPSWEWRGGTNSHASAITM
jgi:hypothetical protein